MIQNKDVILSLSKVKYLTLKHMNNLNKNLILKEAGYAAPSSSLTLQAAAEGIDPTSRAACPTVCIASSSSLNVHKSLLHI